MTDLEALRPYATLKQARTLDALISCGSARKAAKMLGISHSEVSRSLQRLKRVAASKDPSLHTHGAPDGYALRGASTLLDADGAVVQQWVKTVRAVDDPAAFLRVFSEALEDAPPPRAKRARSPRATDADLLAVYPMGDPHLGMLAWAAETGEDNDIVIAEKRLVDATEHLVDLAPPAEHALVINLGDFVHADNTMGVTSRSGHRLDTDSRWAKVLRVAIRTMHRCIDAALLKHRHVTAICEIGNHDDHVAIMLALTLAERYRNEPRVTIDTSPSPFHWYEHGKCLIGTSHGQAAKPEILPGIMAHDQAEAWGRTLWRFWYVGHYHHTRVREFPGCVVEVFRTLAPRDAWAHAAGYRSGQDMVCDVLHREHGRVLRHAVGVEQLRRKS